MQKKLLFPIFVLIFLSCGLGNSNVESDSIVETLLMILLLKKQLQHHQLLVQHQQLLFMFVHQRIIQILILIILKTYKTFSIDTDTMLVTKTDI